MNWLDEFITVLLALLLSPPITSLLSTLNTLRVEFDNPNIFNKEVSNTTILLKS